MHSRDAKLQGLKILTLDGGDARCMSELHLLGEYMSRLEHHTGMNFKPCEYFDLIVGVDAAAFIAALLVLFGMNVEDAMEEFCAVYADVFEAQSHTHEQRAVKLKERLRFLMSPERFNIPETSKLQDVGLGGKCKLALCYSAAVSIGNCRTFCNYTHSSLDSQPTVSEAICAAWALPGLISPAIIGPLGRGEGLISAVGFINPTHEAIKEAFKLFGGEQHVSCLISLGSGKRGVLSIDTEDLFMSISPEAVANNLEQRLGNLKVYQRFSVEHGLEKQTIFNADFGKITSHSATYLSGKTISDRMDFCAKLSTRPTTVTMEGLYRSKVREKSSSHGLPPLSAFFVMREKPMNAVAKALLKNKEAPQRIMVIVGLGGSGKTQLALKFARTYADHFKHILFVDASSPARLESGIIARVRSIDPECDATTIEEAIQALEDANDAVTKNWLIIFDNADDPTMTLPIPNCDHGAILITTRNPFTGNLSRNHIKLDAMSSEEATEALRISIFGSNSSESSETREGPIEITARDQEAIAAIAEGLQYLPIAIIQAGCSIRIRYKHRLYDYLQLLEKNPKLLDQPTPHQRDRDTLRYEHSAYAAFDITLKGLPKRARQLLGILSFFHFANFPQSLFSIAAESQFLYDPYDLSDRQPEFHQSAQFLSSILCPDGVWEEYKLDELLQELLQYSLVTLVPIHSIVTLRFHPLLLACVQDRMSREDKVVHRAAAVRLLICGTSWDNEYIFEYLVPHISTLHADSDALHVNDQAAITHIMRHDKKTDILLSIWKRIYGHVLEKHGKEHLRTTRAALGLGDAYGENSNIPKMEELERWAVVTQEGLLGRGHAETLTSRSNFARTLCKTKRYKEAEEIQQDVLRTRIKSFGLGNKETALALEDLSMTYHSQSRYSEEQALMLGAVDIRTKVLGRFHVGTIGSIEALAKCHQLQGHIEEAAELAEEALELRERVYGTQHLVTVETITWLAGRYHEQERYKEAEKLRRKEVRIRTQIQGETHGLTLHARFWLGQAMWGQLKFAESANLWKPLLQDMRETYGSQDANTLSVIHWLAKANMELGEYEEAVRLWEESLKGCSATLRDQDNKTWAPMHHLASAYSRIGRYEAAEKLYRDVYERRREVQGQRGKETINAQAWVGRVLFEQGKLEDAVVWTQQALDLKKEVQGVADIDTLGTMHALSLIYVAQERHSDAATLWEDELKLRRDISGSSSDEATLVTIEFLAETYHTLGRYAEAEALLREQMVSCKQIHGESHPRFLNALHGVIRAQMEQQRYKEAEAGARTLVQRCEGVLGVSHMDTLEALRTLAAIHSHQKQHAEAICGWKTILARYKAVSEDHDSWSIDILNQLACEYDKGGLYEDKITVIGGELKGRKLQRGRLSIEVLDLMSDISKSCFENERYDEAVSWGTEVVQLSKEVVEEGHPYTMDAINYCGQIHYDRGEYLKAAEFWREALDLCRANLGEGHEQTLGLMQWLAGAYYGKGLYPDAETLLKEEAQTRKELNGEHDPSFLRANHWYARCCFQQARYREAEDIWREELKARRSMNNCHDETVNVLVNIARACWEDRRYEEASTTAREARNLAELHLEPNHSSSLEAGKLLRVIEHSSDGIAAHPIDGPMSPIIEDGQWDSIDEETPPPVDPRIYPIPQNEERVSISRLLRPWVPWTPTRQPNPGKMFF